MFPIVESLEEDEPTSFRVHYLKGLYNVGKNQLDQAKTSIIKSIELNPKFLKAKLLLANLYLTEKSYDNARMEAIDALKLSPNNYNAIMIKANSKV